MMTNPLYDVLKNKMPQDNGFSLFINQLNEFKRTFHGNAQEEVQKMLNSGQLSQAQFNQYAQMANQIMRVMR